MKQSIIKKFISISLLIFVSNLISAHGMKTEDDLVRYFDNATNLDLIEGIYLNKSGNGVEYWHAIVYNKSTGDFDYFDIDAKTRSVKPYCGKYETHMVRATKYAYTYYVYVVIGGYKYESGAVTFDSMHRSYHWRCDAPIDGGWHVSLKLENKVYPK
jgi:hypothetical protein